MFSPFAISAVNPFSPIVLLSPPPTLSHSNEDDSWSNWIARIHKIFILPISISQDMYIQSQRDFLIILLHIGVCSSLFEEIRDSR